MGNRPEEFDRLLASDGKAKRKEAFDENKAKLQYLPDYEKNVLGSFAKTASERERELLLRCAGCSWRVGSSRRMQSQLRALDCCVANSSPSWLVARPRPKRGCVFNAGPKQLLVWGQCSGADVQKCQLEA